VFGGAINLDGLLRIEVTRTGHESTLGKVIALMQSAERSKPPITRLLERHAGQYLILVLLIAAVTWFMTNNAQAMLAVLVAACPCALALSAPATAVAGIAVAARHGILIRGSAFLEELADTTSLIVDKTGTLTFGALRLQEIQNHSEHDRDFILRLAASLGAASSHPVSRALAAQVKSEQHVLLKEIRERHGMGWWRTRTMASSRSVDRSCLNNWQSLRLLHHCMMDRLPGWQWTGVSLHGCCLRTRCDRKPQWRWLSCVRLASTANCY